MLLVAPHGEAEYQFGITRDGLLGGVLFTNLSSVTEAGSDRFEHLIPAAGADLRVKFDKTNGSNLRIDYAKGKQAEAGWYVGVHEAFQVGSGRRNGNVPEGTYQGSPPAVMLSQDVQDRDDRCREQR
jgi:hypothetical protein